MATDYINGPAFEKSFCYMAEPRGDLLGKQQQQQQQKQRDIFRKWAI